MKRSTDRFLTTHTGSLPRPEDLIRMMYGMGLGLTWGLLHVINLAHFGLAFLAAYVCYQLASVGGMDPLLTLALLIPVFFALCVVVQWMLSRFAMSPLNSLLATFGLTAIIEAVIQYFWTADFRKLESVYSGQKLDGRRPGDCRQGGSRRDSRRGDPGDAGRNPRQDF